MGKMNGISYGNINGENTFGKTPFTSHYPKINGIQWDYFNGKQWENLPKERFHTPFFGVLFLIIICCIL